MPDGDLNERWRVDGKFFRSGNRRVWLRAVTYGPFPGGWPDSFESDFQRIAAANFNAIRLFEMPSKRLLDSASQYGLRVFAGLKWGQHADFFRSPALYSSARVQLVSSLKESSNHPAMAGVYVGNEVPADLARWMGPLLVRQAIECLIDLAREIAPHLLFAYANYPSTEYLEPENADFSAFNVYLERPDDFQKYLKRLHHIAGDRPLVISEFGMDSLRNGPDRQKEVLTWACEIADQEEAAGLTIYAWSDRWWNNGAEVLDWDFGLTDRKSNDKPALKALQDYRLTSHPFTLKFSVIVCTRNGRDRIGTCLNAVRKLEGNSYEVIVVDDGSSDGTADYVAKHFPEFRLLRLTACGLSAARNAGAAIATGQILAFTDDDCEPDCQWLARLERVFREGIFAAAGGPNLPPKPHNWQQAVVCAAPGAPSHVMLNDDEAEHLPGCHLAVTKIAFNAIGGFDPQFHTAGDDVDFSWRLRSSGYRLGFAPGAFVWHFRRPSILAFLRQQHGYGKAERLLIAKHPEKFSQYGDAQWEGFVYAGGPVRVMADSIIYHGTMGTAGYQSVTNRMLPLRKLDARFDSWIYRTALCCVNWLVPRLRAWARNRRIFLNHETRHIPTTIGDCDEFTIDNTSQSSREYLLQKLLADGWEPCDPTSEWDVHKNNTQILLATEQGIRGSKHTLVRVGFNGKKSISRGSRTTSPCRIFQMLVEWATKG